MFTGREGHSALTRRPTTGLARLLKRQGKTEEAHRMLAEIYGWFTEGFDGGGPPIDALRGA